MPDDWMQRGVTGDGVQHVTSFTRMPVKVPGRHRWIGIATYTATDEDARRAHEGSDVIFDIQKIVHFSIGCLDCEEPYETCFTRRCSAEEFNWEEHGP